MKTLDQAIQLYQVLGLYGDIRVPKVAYAIARTRIALRDTVQAFDSANKIPQEAEEYEAQRIELCNELCTKGPEGPIHSGIAYAFSPQAREELDVRIAELKEKYPLAEESLVRHRERLIELLKQPVEEGVKICPLDSSDLLDGETFGAGDLEFLIDIGFVK